MYIYGRVNSIIRVRSLYAKACNWKVAIWSSFLHGKCQLSTCPPVDSRFCYGKRLMSTEEWVDSLHFPWKVANRQPVPQSTKYCSWMCQLSTVDLSPGRQKIMLLKMSTFNSRLVPWSTSEHRCGNIIELYICMWCKNIGWACQRRICYHFPNIFSWDEYNICFEKCLIDICRFSLIKKPRARFCNSEKYSSCILH